MSSFYDENNHNFKPSTNFREMGKRKFGREIRPKRRALSMLNQGIVEAQARPCIVTKRPVSERSAITFSSSQNHCHQESKKQKPSVPSTNGSGDGIFIDEEDNKGAADQAVPMSLEPTKPSTKIPQMEEIEMEDIEELIEDIDSCDSKNPLAVVDYIDDMHAFYRQMENFSCVDPNYMAQQSDINEKMRAILIDWLIEVKNKVHDKCELMKETLFLCVNLIDRFLSQQPVIRKKLQLVGLVAMLLACKYEEVSVPVVGDLIIISDKAYDRKDILRMEKLMLNKLHFNMSLPTPYVFIQRFLKAAQCEKKIELLSFYLIELSLVEYEMLKFPPSLLAAAAIYTAQCTVNGFKQWSRTCEWHSNYSENQLLECSRLMVGYQQKAGRGKLTGVYRKYNTWKYDYTSKCEAATFLLETEHSN